VSVVGTQTTMLACGLIVIVLRVAALAAGDVRRLQESVAS
jgi:hypothetical protein